MKTPIPLSLLNLAIPLAQAVTLENHTDPDCKGVSTTCSNIGQSICCDAMWYISSTKATGLGDTWIGSIFEDGATDCGTVNNSGFGDSVCINSSPRGTQCTGTMWHKGCCQKRDDEEGQSQSTPNDLATLWSLPKGKRDAALNGIQCLGKVKPDKLKLADGHVFEIGEASAKEDVDALLELAKKDFGMTIDKVPEHLLKLKVVVDVKREDEEKA